MIKRLMVTVLLISIFPVMANAWYLNTQAKNGGGTITSRNMVAQTSAQGSLFKSYTTHAALSATVVANTGYSISNVTVNGVSITNPVSPYNTTVQGMNKQIVLATFAATRLSVTASAGAGGTVLSPASLSNIYYGKSLASALVFTFTPQTGYRLAELTGAAGATVSAAIPANINAKVTVTYPIGYAFTAPVAISGTFGSDNPIAIAGAPQTVLSGALVTLTASHAGGSGATPIFSWDQYSGPSVTLLRNDNLASFTASTAGTYRFRVTLDSGSSAITSVVVNDSVVAAVRTMCQVCHSAAMVGTSANVFNKWSSSRHGANLITCARCHIGADSGGHPGPSLTSLSFLNVCTGCHFDGSGTVPGHPVDIGSTVCSTCHDPHSLVATGPGDSVHFNNVTTGVYPASYVTSRTTCASCHVSGPANSAIRQQWKMSGHADNLAPAWMNNDFKTKSGCVQCHSATGFIAYSTGRVTAAWGDAADKTKEVLSCVGCHLNVTTGALRTVTPITPYADDAYSNPELGKSNLCMNCHSGTKNGKSITAQLQALADFTDLPFIGSHNMAAGGTSYGRVGYHFDGRTYNGAAVHSAKLGTDGSGSCVACHKNSENGHKFQAGATALCTSCHGATFNAARLSSDRTAFLNALEVLRAQLAANGYPYSPNYPYFSNSNWGAGQAGADTMGAAFNYVLFLTEPGAYAHNPLYASQLVIDSIDYLDNGQFDDSVGSLAVPGLLGDAAITQAVADSMTVYRTKNPCLTCHGGTTSTSAPMATNAHDAHLSSAYGPGFYLGSALSSCQSCHVFGEATHMNGSAELLTGVGSACDSCHPGVKPSWSGARVNCTVCHAAVPSTLPNGVAAPYKADFVSKGHGQFANSNQCVSCHDPDTSHISGSLGAHTRLRLLNDNNLCASCHRNAAVVGASFLNMTTHVSLSCRTCHDPHGTSNPSMIRANIAGTAISFTETTTGLIDTGTNLGLCQVCHVSGNTAFYQAGVQETNHYTTGCLNCHKHKSGFKPSGCDSCHGYPPAPVITSNVVGFGTASNWVSARFEDYSGGGGAHLVPAHVSPFAVPSEGWTNCTMCHNGGSTGTTPYHVMATPVASHISNITVDVDRSYRFDSGFTIYTGARNLDPPALNATGSCFNISCHLSASPRWSMER